MVTRKKKKVKKNNKTRKRLSPIKKKIKKLEKIFKQYPDIFPRGYYRFFETSMRKKLENKEIIFKNGVILTWKLYKRDPGKNKPMNKGDLKINQLVNKNQGNGMAKKIFVAFLKKHKDKNIFLDVKKDNKRAIQFYKKNGFKKIGNTKFGDIQGIIMKKSKNLKGGG